MDGAISTPIQFDTFTLNVPKAEVSFFKTMAKKMGWTIERKKKKVIEDSMNGKGIVWAGTAEEFKEWAKAL